MGQADLKALIDLDVDEAASIALDWRDEIDGKRTSALYWGYARAAGEERSGL